jgi:NTE family protein
VLTMGDAELSVVLSGGVALGAYQGGIYEGLHRSMHRVGWIAGSSVGAVNGALIAGVPVEKREETLRRYWLTASPWQVDPCLQLVERGPGTPSRLTTACASWWPS